MDLAAHCCKPGDDVEKVLIKRHHADEAINAATGETTTVLYHEVVEKTDNLKSFFDSIKGSARPPPTVQISLRHVNNSNNSSNSTETATATAAAPMSVMLPSQSSVKQSQSQLSPVSLHQGPVSVQQSSHLSSGLPRAVGVPMSRDQLRPQDLSPSSLSAPSSSSSSSCHHRLPHMIVHGSAGNGSSNGHGGGSGGSGSRGSNTVALRRPSNDVCVTLGTNSR